jgi:hypothetical protein
VKQQVGKVRALARALCSCHTVTQKCASSAQNAMLPTSAKVFVRQALISAMLGLLLVLEATKFTKHGNSCAVEKISETS